MSKVKSDAIKWGRRLRRSRAAFPDIPGRYLSSAVKYRTRGKHAWQHRFKR